MEKEKQRGDEEKDREEIKKKRAEIISMGIQNSLNADSTNFKSPFNFHLLCFFSCEHVISYNENAICLSEIGF